MLGLFQRKSSPADSGVGRGRLPLFVRVTVEVTVPPRGDYTAGPPSFEQPPECLGSAELPTMHAPAGSEVAYVLRDDQPSTVRPRRGEDGAEVLTDRGNRVGRLENWQTFYVTTHGSRILARNQIGEDLTAGAGEGVKPETHLSGGRSEARPRSHLLRLVEDRRVGEPIVCHTGEQPHSMGWGRRHGR